jgi:hypothetical protein
MYHVELRETIHNTHLFNLEAEDLETRIVAPWLRGKVLDVGERKWVPDRTRLTILEGPQLSLGELGLGRGWNNAVRRGNDVTAEMIDSARGRLPTAAAVPLREPDYEHDLLALCASQPVSPLAAWKLADSLPGDPAPWQRLALADGTLRQLVIDGKIEFVAASGEAAALDGSAVDAALRSSEQWAGDDVTGAVVARATASGRAALSN